MIPRIEDLRATPEGIREITSLARKLLQVYPDILESFAQRRTVAEHWMEAALLEASGRNAEAADVLDLVTDRTWGEERALRLLAIARNRKDALYPLMQAARVATTNRTLAAIDKLRAGLPAKRRCKIGLVGSATMDLWAPALRALCFSWGIDAELYIGPFQQYHQEILDPGSGLAAFRPDVVIIAAEWRALGLPDESADPDATVREKLALFQTLWLHCREHLGASVIQHNFEVPEIDAIGRLGAGRQSVVQRLNLSLQAAGEVAILDVEQTAAVFGKARWNDPVLWQAAKQYPAPNAIPDLMRQEAALIRAALGLTSKCLVLDLDGTLWGGVIGEDGVAGIHLGGSAEGESYVAFQQYIHALQRRGVILAVCSKNNEEDAQAPFLQHPEMVLKLDDIALFVANWKTKDENLRQIAETLNIGLDSLVFVDDNAMERNLIRRLLPEVEVPELPPDPAHFSATLHRSLLFEAWCLTEDDRQRGAAYRLNRERRREQAQTGNVDEYLASLQMKVELRPFDHANLLRIVQLINKTNQFNLTTRRMTEAQCLAWMHRADCYTQFVRLSDRFGDHGITGILIAFLEEGNLRIDSWLLSCRVLGRRVEDAMLAGALRFAELNACRGIIGEFIPTAKNGQVSGIYAKFGFRVIQEDAGGRSVFIRALDPFYAPEWLQIEDSTQRLPTTYDSIR